MTAFSLAALALAACGKGNLANKNESADPLRKACLGDDICIVGAPFKQGKSLSGNFLAGRHAQVVFDMSSAADFLDTALKLSPEEPDLLRRTFILLVAEGRMEEALPLARRVVAINNDNPVASIILAVDHFKNGRYAEVEEHLAAAPKNGLSIYIAPALGAWARFAQGKPLETAVEALKGLDKENGSQALHDLHYALISDVSGNIELAIEKFKAAIISQGGLSLRLAQLFGNLLERAGKPNEAKDLYQKYLDEHPNTRILAHALNKVNSDGVNIREIATPIDGAAEALFGIAGSLSQQNIRETALLLGRMALYLKPNFPVMQLLIADIMEAETRLETANQIYKSIDINSPFSWAARISYAANLDEMEQTDEAILQLSAMANAEPDQVEPLINLGNILRRRERYKEAVSAYDRALDRVGEHKAKHWSLYYSRGISLERSKQWPRAEADFLKALEYEPDQPFVLNYLGYSWVEQGINLDRAKEMIRKAVKLRPTDGYIVDSLGWVLYRLGEYEAAVGEMERAVELRPQDPVINDHLGDVYWKVDRKEEARFQWKRALSLKPEPELRAIIEGKLKKGLADGAGGDI